MLMGENSSALDSQLSSVKDPTSLKKVSKFFKALNSDNSNASIKSVISSQIVGQEEQKINISSSSQSSEECKQNLRRSKISRISERDDE